MTKLRSVLSLVIALLGMWAGLTATTIPQEQKLKVIHQVAPVYPEAAKRAQVEGKATVDVTVERNGEVSIAKVVNGPQLLQQSAVDAVRQWRFSNPLNDSVTIQLTLVFSLKPDADTEKKQTQTEKEPLTNTRKVNAIYPEDAMRQGIQGEVAVEIKINDEAQVTDARALSGPELLRQPAVDAAKQFRFSNDRKAPVVATLTFNFVL